MGNASPNGIFTKCMTVPWGSSSGEAEVSGQILPSTVVLESSGILRPFSLLFLLYEKGAAPHPSTPPSSKSHVFRKLGKPKIQRAKEK